MTSPLQSSPGSGYRAAPVRPLRESSAFRSCAWKFGISPTGHMDHDRAVLGHRLAECASQGISAVRLH